MPALFCAGVWLLLPLPQNRATPSNSAYYVNKVVIELNSYLLFIVESPMGGIILYIILSLFFVSIVETNLILNCKKPPG